MELVNTKNLSETRRWPFSHTTNCQPASMSHARAWVSLFLTRRLLWHVARHLGRRDFRLGSASAGFS